MKTIINIDGGIGRVMTSIPALLKYAKNHPDDEWYIMCYGWDFCFWGIEELQPRVYHPEQRGVFDSILWNADEVITPEPYRLPAYYRHEISLAQAFDRLINNTTDHSDLPELELPSTLPEKMRARDIVGQAGMSAYGADFVKRKIVVIQPYGSTVTKTNLGFYDEALKSIPDDYMKEIVSALEDDCLIINMNGAGNYSQFDKVVNIQEEFDIRTWIAIIRQVDYFIGCDSCGQHIAKGVNTPASVFIAGTHEVNVSYPDDFHIIKNDATYYPCPIRFSESTCELSSKLNEKRLVFTDKERKEYIDTIVTNIKGTKRRKKICCIKEMR